MELDQALTNVAVLGAGGKMGAGISFLLLREMAVLQARSGINTTLVLIDVNAQALFDLRKYLEEQLLKYAEKNINELRNYYKNSPKLVSNQEIIESFIHTALEAVYFDTSLERSKSAHLIFEAIAENIELKISVFKKIVELGNKEGFFLSNTSSIPIQLLNEKAHLNNRIIGFHFYNPPVVQKLVEVIPTIEINSNLKKISEELAKRLNKTVVYSNDVAGFIGNGHMIREIVFACKKVEELSSEYSLPESIYLVNRVTQDWLIRPMGIFQLVDYVGIDVCLQICKIMQTYLRDTSLKMDLMETMLERGIKGGQNVDGSQKNGFFMYKKHTLMGIYSIPANKYIPFADAHWIISADRALGEIPKGHESWKNIQKEKEKEILLKNYFDHLYSQNTFGSRLAQIFLENSENITLNLIKDGVASSINDVDLILKSGFFHLYGPEAGIRDISKIVETN